MSERADEDRHRTRKPRRPWGHVILQLTLARMPELELFETEAQRKRALSEIGEEISRTWSWAHLIAVAIIVVSVFTAGQVTGWVCAQLGISGIKLWVKLVVMGLTLIVSLRAMHRWGAREDLRRKLLEYGIPVCMKCGYSLRGLSLAIGRCPECGADFDGRVGAILAPLRTR